jgi:hypothetical protein
MVNGPDDFEESERRGRNKKQDKWLWSCLSRLTEQAFVRRLVRNEWRRNSIKDGISLIAGIRYSFADQRRNE